MADYVHKDNHAIYRVGFMRAKKQFRLPLTAALEMKGDEK
jgi:hypothetical protein